MEVRVKWKDLKRETLAPSGVKLSYLITKENIDFPFPCGGEGVCGRCRVRFLENPPPATSVEERLLTPQELASGVRLACQAVVYHDTVVELMGADMALPQDFLLDVVDLIPRGEPPRRGKRAAALDLGTTTLALSLLDLEGPSRLATQIMSNPQRVWGGEVVSRIKAAQEGRGKDMARVVWDLLLPHLEGTSYLVVAGNAAMETILAGLSVDSLARYPFQAAFTGGQWREEPFPHYLMPLVGRFLGGDTAALLLVLDLIEAKRPALVMDLGTNAEVLLLTKKGIKAASAPAGPAFEGMGVSCGVGLVPGAITGVEKGKHGLVFHTLEGGFPIGFCGSGLLAVLAFLLREGVVDATGKIREAQELSPFWRDMRTFQGLSLGQGIILTQEDIRKVQLAKGAVTSAWRTLLDLEGRRDEPEVLYLAGAFGSALALEDLRTLGLVPQGVREVVYLGNASLVGAEAVALSQMCLERVEGLAREVEVVDLASQKGYQDIYMESLFLGEPDDS